PIPKRRSPEPRCICQPRILNPPYGSGTSSGGRLSPVLPETIPRGFPQTPVATSSFANRKEAFLGLTERELCLKTPLPNRNGTRLRCSISTNGKLRTRCNRRG